MQVLNIPIIFWQIVENTTDTKELQDNFAIAENKKYVVKHKSAKLFMTYAVGKLEAALNIIFIIFNIKYKQSES